jgi:hypothetical protein
MAQRWIKEIAPDELRPEKSYFIAQKFGIHGNCYAFYSQGLKGKRSFTSKPGIALRYAGGDELRAILEKHPELVFLEVPADADKRWRARKPVRSWMRRK